MQVQGLMFVAGHAEKGSGAAFAATEATSGAVLQPDFHTANAGEIERALAAAARAAPAFAASTPAARAALLEAIADAIAGLGDELIVRGMQETGLARPRLEGERARTMNQLRLFATVLRDGHFLRARIDRADETPNGATHDLRLWMQPLGPVAVFGSSNFPLAFSVAGGDTASALAAGCPVIVKGHPAHPGMGELVARAVTTGVASSGFDPGVFSFLQDGGIDVGQALAKDARIKAIGFTGSRRAGEALMALAAARPEPIPVYAEMSATNPVVLLPGRLAEAADDVARAFVASLTLCSGQFCTNPGLVLAIDGPALERFLAAAGEAVRGWSSSAMLTAGIQANYARTSGEVAAEKGVATLATSARRERHPSALLFVTDARTYIARPTLRQEMFGPASLVVRCADLDELQDALRATEGQLTIAVHMNASDRDAARQLLPLLLQKAGRVLANGFGTGVEVSPAMVHGGPWPATSDGRTTSVGTMAIERFLRPVCLQDFPEELRPEAVRDANPWGVPRREW